MTQHSQPSAAPGGRPGQMTAVMRAVAATGPKVLRIGLVQSGRVIEERIIKQRTHVTVGPNEKNMFVVTAGNLPASFRLFELVGSDYTLNFLEGMTGRVALPTGISDLAVLKGQARKNQQGAYQIRLTDDSRGKAGAMSNAQAAALSNQLDQMEMATLGALSGAGPATEGVLKTGEVPTGALDKAAASSAGVGVGGLSLGGGGGAIRPGSAGGGLGSIGSTGTGAGTG